MANFSCISLDDNDAKLVRYPYEYEGGHIKGAVNIVTQDQMTECYFSNPTLQSSRQVHCSAFQTFIKLSVNYSSIAVQQFRVNYH